MKNLFNDFRGSKMLDTVCDFLFIISPDYAFDFKFLVIGGSAFGLLFLFFKLLDR